MECNLRIKVRVVGRQARSSSAAPTSEDALSLFLRLVLGGGTLRAPPPWPASRGWLFVPPCNAVHYLYRSNLLQGDGSLNSAFTEQFSRPFVPPCNAKAVVFRTVQTAGPFRSAHAASSKLWPPPEGGGAPPRRSRGVPQFNKNKNIFLSIPLHPPRLQPPSTTLLATLLQRPAPAAGFVQVRQLQREPRRGCGRGRIGQLKAHLRGHGRVVSRWVLWQRLFYITKHVFWTI